MAVTNSDLVQKGDPLDISEREYNTFIEDSIARRQRPQQERQAGKVAPRLEHAIFKLVRSVAAFDAYTPVGLGQPTVTPANADEIAALSRGRLAVNQSAGLAKGLWAVPIQKSSAAGDLVAAVRIGEVWCWITVEDTAHEYADVVESAVKSAETGYARIMSEVTETGLQLVLLELGWTASESEETNPTCPECDALKACLCTLVASLDESDTITAELADELRTCFGCADPEPECAFCAEGTNPPNPMTVTISGVTDVAWSGDLFEYNFVDSPAAIFNGTHQIPTSCQGGQLAFSITAVDSQSQEFEVVALLQLFGMTDGGISNTFPQTWEVQLFIESEGGATGQNNTFHGEDNGGQCQATYNNFTPNAAPSGAEQQHRYMDLTNISITVSP